MEHKWLFKSDTAGMVSISIGLAHIFSNNIIKLKSAFTAIFSLLWCGNGVYETLSLWISTEDFDSMFQLTLICLSRFESLSSVCAGTLQKYIGVIFINKTKGKTTKNHINDRLDVIFKSFNWNGKIDV